MAAVDSAFSRKEPVLIYFYKPHSAFAKYDLTNVTLPENTAACYSEENKAAGKVDCDYPTDLLFKIASTTLKTSAPDAYTLLSRMSYSTDEQIKMVAAIDTDGKPAAEAARAWVDANESIWKAWLP